MVLEIDVVCPLDVHTETDFLTRAVGVNLTLHICTPTVPRQCGHENRHEIGHEKELEKGHGEDLIVRETRREAVISTEFVDEEEVWESYMELPGTVLQWRFPPLSPCCMCVTAVIDCCALHDAFAGELTNALSHPLLLHSLPLPLPSTSHLPSALTVHWLTAGGAVLLRGECGEGESTRFASLS
jgi:hypothetical protein